MTNITESNVIAIMALDEKFLASYLQLIEEILALEADIIPTELTNKLFIKSQMIVDNLPLFPIFFSATAKQFRSTLLKLAKLVEDKRLAYSPNIDNLVKKSFLTTGDYFKRFNIPFEDVKQLSHYSLPLSGERGDTRALHQKLLDPYNSRADTIENRKIKSMAAEVTRVSKNKELSNDWANFASQLKDEYTNGAQPPTPF